MELNNQSPLLVGACNFAYYPHNPEVQEILWDDVEWALTMNFAFGGSSKPAYAMAQHATLLSLLFDTPMYQYASFFVIGADVFVGYYPDTIKAIMPKETLEMIDRCRDNLLRSMLKTFNLPLSASEVAGIRKYAEVAYDAAYYALVLKDLPPFLVSTEAMNRGMKAHDFVSERYKKILHEPSNFDMFSKTGIPINRLKRLFEITPEQQFEALRGLTIRHNMVRHDAKLNRERLEKFN